MLLQLTATTSSITSPVSVATTSSHQSCEEILAELLALPQPPPPQTCQRKKTKAKEITDPDVLQEMKDKEVSKAVARNGREENKLEREQKAKE